MPEGEPTANDRWRRVKRGAVRGAVVLPIVVAVVRALARGWFPVGDNALLAVRAFDVGTSHHPLLGSWTSASLAVGTNVNNPGPLYSDLAAPFMWTIGRLWGIGPATAIAIGVINAVFAVGALVVAGRIGGWRVERWIALAVAALTWSMGSELLIDIWQPHALLLPFVCLLVLSVAVWLGDLWCLPWWLGVASLIVQTHVAYVYVVAVLTLTLAAALVMQRRAVDGPAARRITWIGAGVVALAWSQPLVEQLFGEGSGNLRRLAGSAGGGELTVGAGPAVKLVASVVALPPWWTRPGFEDAVPSTPLTQTADGPRLIIEGLPGAAAALGSLGIVVAIVIALLVALRTPEQRAARAALAISLVGLAVAVAGLAIQTVTLTGLGSHQLRWVFALGAFVHAAIAWGVAELTLARWPQIERGVATGTMALGAVLVVANVGFHAHDLGPTADRTAQATLERTFADLARWEPGGPVVYEIDNVRVFEPNSWAVMMRMRELGIDFRVTDEVAVRHLGNARRADGDEVATVRQYERADALLYDGDGCRLSLRSGVSGETEARIDAVISAAADGLVSGTLTVDGSGLPDDVAALLGSALQGDRDAAFRFVAQGLTPVLVDEGRVVPVPALAAAARANDEIIERVNTTLLVVARPSSTC